MNQSKTMAISKEKKTNEKQNGKLYINKMSKFTVLFSFFVFRETL